MPQRTSARRELIAAAAFVAAMLFFVYAIADRSVGYGSDAVAVAVLVSLGLVHLATGCAIAKWWAVLLPFAVIPLTVPAGSPARGEDAIPIWTGLVWFTAPVGALLIGVAAAVARLAAKPPRPRPGRH